MNKIIIVSCITAFVFATVIGYLYNASAQTIDSHMPFVKSFCTGEDTILDGITYINGQELSYDTSGCPTVIKVIHNWSDLSTANKNIITSRLQVAGYTIGNLTDSSR